jgi:hypothetical protein
MPEPGQPPPPGGPLLEAVGSMRPVRTRVPARTLLLLLVVGLVAPVAAVIHRTRPDLPFLPVAWVVVMALAWVGGVVAPLLAALIPRRGQVLPDGARAGRIAALSTALLVLLGLVATVDAPGRTVIPDFPEGWWHCVSFGLKIAAPVLLASAVVLRRLHPVGSWRVSAALGAAGGALGGLTLHFICGYGGGLHVGLAHAGAAVLAAGIGAVVLAPWVRS